MYLSCPQKSLYALPYYLRAVVTYALDLVLIDYLYNHRTINICTLTQQTHSYSLGLGSLMLIFTLVKEFKTITFLIKRMIQNYYLTSFMFLTIKTMLTRFVNKAVVQGLELPTIHIIKFLTLLHDDEK